MAYDVRSVSTVSGTGTSFTIASPAGTQPTDSVFVLLVHSQNVQVNADDPFQGWTLATDSAFAADTTTRVLQTSSLASSGPWTFNFLRGGVLYSDTYAAAAVAVSADTAITSAQRPVLDVAAALVTAPTTGPFVFPSVTPGNTGDVILYVGGWGRYTTLTPPGGVTQRAEVSSGTSSIDKTLWVGSAAAATSSGVPTGTVTVTNDNPGAFTQDAQGVITVAIKSVAPVSAWTGDFETGDFSQYAFVLQAAPGRITVRTDSPRQGTYYARFAAHNADVYPLTPTDNPRASLVGPRILFPGTTRWLSWSTRFPGDFPAVPGDGWLVFWQYHGPPYVGSPSLGFGVVGTHLALERNQSYAYDTIWTGPMPRDRWIDFRMLVRFAQDSTGFVELWVDGVQQVFTAGRRRLYMRTIEPDQISGVEIDPLLYRDSDMFEFATLDHDDVRFDVVPPAGLRTTVAPVVAGVREDTPRTVRARVV